MAATLTRTDEALELSLAGCRGSEFQDVLAKAKEVPGRRFDSVRKLWLFPPEADIAERIILAIRPEANEEVEEWVTESRVEGERDLVTPLPEDGELCILWANQRAPWQPEEINGAPYTGLKAHQRALIQVLADKAGAEDNILRAIIADDMGLGKTVQIISTAAEIAVRQALQVPDLGPKNVVCPKSVMGVWARELGRWLGPDEDVYVADGSTVKSRETKLTDGIADNGWCIVNYEQLRVHKVERKTRTGGKKTEWLMKQPLFEKTPWAAVIADEAHRAKNRKAAQTRGLFRTRGKIMIAATGTPLMNQPGELWSLLHWLYPDEYTSYWRFFDTYVDYVEGYHGRDIIGVKNPEALAFELRGRMFRRTKRDVLKDLPEKERIFIPVDLGAKQRKLYEEAESNLWLEVEKAIDEGDISAMGLAKAADAGIELYQIPNGAARLVRLRQVLSSPALLGGADESAKLDAVEEAIIDNSHKPHVVFSEFVMTCSLLAERLEKHGLSVSIYTGETTGGERTDIEDGFQRGEIDVVIGTIGAMREGITLTAADTVHFVERAWVPGWNEQAEDRLHRIGQRNAVTVYVYEGTKTVDDGRIKPTIRLKEKIVRTILPKDEVKET